MALIYSTDAVIQAKNFVLLQDDKHLQLADNIAPVARVLTNRAEEAPYRRPADAQVIKPGDPIPLDTYDKSRRYLFVLDGNGGFVLDRLTAGDWTISVVKRGYLADARLVSLSEGDATISFSLAVDDEPLHPERPEPLAARK